MSPLSAVCRGTATVPLLGAPSPPVLCGTGVVGRNCGGFELSLTKHGGKGQGKTKPVSCPCPQIDQLRAELLQERSSRQDLECDKVSLERQVRLSRGGAGSCRQPWGHRRAARPLGHRAKHLGAAPLPPRASLGEGGPCSQGAFPAVNPFPAWIQPDPSCPCPIPGWSILGAVPGWHSRWIPPFLTAPCSNPFVTQPRAGS